MSHFHSSIIKRKDEACSIYLEAIPGCSSYHLSLIQSPMDREGEDMLGRCLVGWCNLMNCSAANCGVFVGKAVSFLFDFMRVAPLTQRNDITGTVLFRALVDHAGGGMRVKESLSPIMTHIECLVHDDLESFIEDFAPLVVLEDSNSEYKDIDSDSMAPSVYARLRLLSMIPSPS